MLLLALTICGVLAVPAVASAADLTNSGGTLTYTGTDANGVVNFSATGTPGQVRVDSFGADTITTSNCTPSGGGGFTCDGVASIVANGNGGDDIVSGDSALSTRMTINGGAGDDFLSGGAGADDLHGGSGIDSADESDFSNPPKAVSVTLDDQANDGATGEGDNVHSDVEDVSGSSSFGGFPATAFGTVTLVGSATTNDLSVGSGRGNLDGGAGNDILSGGGQDDTISSRDGFADRVTCGGGNDTVIADNLDQISDNCENVSIADVGNANQDKQPTIAWTAPADNAVLSTSTPNTLSVTAADDKGVTKVQFLAGNRLVCEDPTAPYSCAYKPTGADSGKLTLAAIAIDGAQQTATALKPVRIGRFTPGLSEKISPSKDTKAPFRFRVTGTVGLPAGMTKAEGCSAGKVSVQVKAGSKTISTRRVEITSNCTYSSTVSFNSRKRFGRAKSLKFTSRFTGNSVLGTKSASSKTGKVR